MAVKKAGLLYIETYSNYFLVSESFLVDKDSKVEAE